MSRHADTCALAAFLSANPAKREEQATAVLASVLQSSESFARAFLGQLGVDETGAMAIDTEVATGVEQDRLNLRAAWHGLPRPRSQQRIVPVG